MSARVMLMVRCRRQTGAVPQMLGQAFECDDWWLVEAETADAAREVIAACEEAAKAVREAGGVSYDPTSTRWAFGRVLAHGGTK